MKKYYDVYFEIFGKKMKTKVFATSLDNAKEAVKNKIVFHKIVETPKDDFNEIMDVFDNILDKLNIKK